VTRAHFFRTASDDQGNVVPGTTVTVYETGTLAVLADTLYVNEVGSTTRDNPFVVNDGIIDFYLDSARQVKVGLRSPSGIERFTDNLDVYPDPKVVVQAPTGLQITNIPQAGDFLQATGDGQATWVQAPSLETVAVTPLHTILQQFFSSSSIGPLTLRSAGGTMLTPTFVDVTSDPKPAGFTFTKAMDWSSTQSAILSTAPLLFAEGGMVQFLYKILGPTAGKTPGFIRTTVDDGSLWMQTPISTENYNAWTIGYLTNIPAGTHVVRLTHTLGSDVAARVLLGAIIVQYGGQVPPHTHEATGLLSTTLGAGASANFSGATALGGHASVSGVNGTAVGANSTADSSGVAVGATASAVPLGVAIGYQARTSSPAVGGVAVGRNANAQAANAVALGADAVGAGTGSVAAGSGALAYQDGIALGREAAATAVAAVAIGAEAQALYDRSVALGPGSETTAADQIALGTPDSTTVIPGALRQHGDATIGAMDSTVGFFGEAGTSQPVVSGSRGGNALLGSLITHLANLGLIDDQTTP
jgi:hypothetical protein